MIDTSALVAALVSAHEYHSVARRHVSAATRVPAIVVAETYAQLRRTFAQPASVASRLLAPWSANAAGILPTTASCVAAVFRRAVELDLAGNVHDALIAQTCIQHRVPLVTLDTRQHNIALALGCESVNLLAR